MTIAEKLTAIADNQVKVYEAGKSAGEDLSRYASVVQFNNLNLFGKKEVVLNLDNCTTLVNLFAASVTNTTVEHITVNCPNQITNGYNVFQFNSYPDHTLKHITFNVDYSKAVNAGSLFANAQKLEVIDGTPIDLTSVVTTVIEWAYLYSLIEIRIAEGTIYKNFKMSHSSELSDASIESIIEGLADLSDGTTQVLTLHASVKARLTDEQLAFITEKNWTVA